MSSKGVATTMVCSESEAICGYDDV